MARLGVQITLTVPTTVLIGPEKGSLSGKRENMRWRKLKVQEGSSDENCNNLAAVILSDKSLFEPSAEALLTLVLAPGASHAPTNSSRPEFHTLETSWEPLKLNWLVASFTSSYQRHLQTKQVSRKSVTRMGPPPSSQSKSITGQCARLRPMEPEEERGWSVRRLFQNTKKQHYTGKRD